MMEKNQDYFKIESNNAILSRGKILISEPFMRDPIFGRSVVLLEIGRASCRERV